MIAGNLKICMIPLEIFWGDKEKNLLDFQKKLELVESDTDLVVLPETFTTGFPSPDDDLTVKQVAETDNGKTIRIVKECSEKYNFAIAGSFIAKTETGCSNRAFFATPDKEVFFADKRHLFSYSGEDKFFEPGHERLSITFRGWNIAMIVCYDLRFPVWCRNVNNEFDLMIAVANWPVSRIRVWDTLLQARAMENSSFVCGVDCKGIDSRGSEYNGSCHVFDYKGIDIAVNISDNDLLYASLNKKRLDDFRQKFPVWKDADSFSLNL